MPCAPFLAQAAFKVIQNELCQSVPSVCVVTQRCPGKLCREPLRLEVGGRATHTGSSPHSTWPEPRTQGLSLGRATGAAGQPLCCSLFPALSQRSVCLHKLSLGPCPPTRESGVQLDDCGRGLRCRAGTPVHAGFRLTATWHRAGRGPFCVAFWLQPWPVFLGAFALPRMSRRPHCALRMFERLVLQVF